MYSIEDYGHMIGDTVRMDAYEAALRAVVRPGAIVLDLGAGTGIFSLLACRLGARRVHAIEPQAAIEVAREVAGANGYGDVVRFHHGLSTTIDIGERVDVIASDLRGILPLVGNSLCALIDARQRFLAPGGTLVALRDTVWIAPVESPQLFERVHEPWRKNAWGLDMRAAASLAANSPSRAEVEADALLTAPLPCVTLDYPTLDATDFDVTVESAIERPGLGHGLCAWFDSVIAPGITMTNAPGAPRLIYGNLYLPWPEAVHVQAGDRVRVRLRAQHIADDYVWSWRTNLVSASGEDRARFDQSSFFGQPMSPSILQAMSAGHVASLSEDGEVDALVLQGMREGLRLGEIAERVATRYPRRFSDRGQAMARVSKLSLRYGRAEPVA